MPLCQIVCVLSSYVDMRVSGDPHITTCVFRVGCVTTFIAALTEDLKSVRSTPALSSFIILPNGRSSI